MTDQLWADVAEFQPYYDADVYPYQVLAIRSNDGTRRDLKFPTNYARAKAALASGKLRILIVYYVYETNWAEAFATHQDMVGTPPARMASMIDMESWTVNGIPRISGDQSSRVNAMREANIRWLGGNRKRVIGYANMGDLRGLWQSYGDTKFVIAAYGSNPSHPAKIAHQFADNYPVPPFGNCDINSADGMTVDDLAAALGIGDDMPLTDADVTKVARATADQIAKNQGTLDAIAAAVLTKLLTTDGLLAAPPDAADQTNPFWTWGGHIVAETTAARAASRKADGLAAASTILAQNDAKMAQTLAAIQVAIAEIGAASGADPTALASAVIDALGNRIHPSA